jgi:hypothetical protein
MKDYGFDFQGARKNPGDPVIVGVYNEEINHWGIDHAGHFMKACSKFWPVRKPKDMEPSGWAQYIHYLNSRHTFSRDQLYVDAIQINPSDTDHSGFVFRYEPFGLNGRWNDYGIIPDHLLRKKKNLRDREGKFNKKALVNLLVECMREAEFVPFEEIPNP